uniref:Putative secreted protein n=1 Tax=Amblyomma americanum TaxID=6943 RepID=A0A0C9R4D6_AMBAM
MRMMLACLLVLMAFVVASKAAPPMPVGRGRSPHQMRAAALQCARNTHLCYGKRDGESCGGINCVCRLRALNVETGEGEMVCMLRNLRIAFPQRRGGPPGTPWMQPPPGSVLVR